MDAQSKRLRPARHTAGRKHTTWQIFRWPVWIAVLNLAGLVLALFDDGGVLDAFAALSLTLTVALCAWFGALAGRWPAKR